MAVASQSAAVLEVEPAAATNEEEPTFRERVSEHYEETRDRLDRGVSDRMLGGVTVDRTDHTFNNVLIQGVMTVLIGGILIVLAGVIISDFVDIMPEENGFMDQETLTDPLATALGLAAISLVVPIVAGVVALLMGSFGGFMGNGGTGGRFR